LLNINLFQIYMDFSDDIIQWYKVNKRDLPWRHTNDPYRIWVSEIILQQTRVEQGLAYYNRFVERFPDIEALSNAEEDEVMKVWQGLGYYSRARNMHRSAKSIQNENQAKFPASYDEIMRMHGVGDYSASAIASIVYGESRPVVDGNVLRVISRYSGIYEPVNSPAGKKKVKYILAGFIDRRQPGDFNQAIMELGALVCKPKQPLCPECPLRQNCFACLNKQTAELPHIKKPKSFRTRFFNYLVIVSNEGNQNYLWLKKRTADDIWKNLYDFPLVETESGLSEKELKNTGQWQGIMGSNSYEFSSVSDNVRHKLSHQALWVKFINISSDNFHHPDYLKVNVLEVKYYAVPKPIENFLKKVDFRPGIFFKFPD
jgi:A/G-specific adenine glycosylase